MKKIKLFLIPFISVPILFSCNTEPNLYEVKFNGENCVLSDAEDPNIITKKYKEGTKVEFKINANDGFNLPRENQLDLKYTSSGESFDDYVYLPEEGSLSFTVSRDITINAISDAKIFYNLSFVGTNCRLLDEDGNEIISKKYEEGTKVNLKIKPYYKFLYPKTNQISFESCSKPDDFNYSEGDGSISFTISGDLKVAARSSADSSYEFRVEESDFNAAIAMTDVSYLQADINASDYYVISPEVNSYRFPSDVNYYDEVINKVTDGGTSYIKYFKNKKDDEYDFDSVTEADFLNPQDVKFRVDDELSGASLAFKDFKYNEDKFCYEATYKDDKYSLEFIDNKLIEFNINDSATYKAVYSYDDVTPTIPDCHRIRQEKFDDAVKMPGVTYLQYCKKENTSGTFFSTYNRNCSPSVYEEENIKSSGDYYQIFVEKKSDGYYMYQRNKEGEDLKESECVSTNFIVPSEIGKHQYDIITSLGVPFSSYIYDDETHTYTASAVSFGVLETMTLEFCFNRLTKVVYSGWSDVTTTFSYNEITPKII